MKSNLLTMLLESVGAGLKPFGFKLVKSKKRYLRKVDGRTELFQLSVLDGDPGYRILPSVGVRFEEVETIFHRTSGFEPEYQKDTPTIGIDVGRVYGKEGNEFRLQDASDLPGVVSGLTSKFRDVAQPYFMSYGDLGAVDAAVNDAPQTACIHRAVPWLRCSTGLIVAKLVGRKNYDALASIYRGMLQHDSKGFYLPQFEALIRDLEASAP